MISKIIVCLLFVASVFSCKKIVCPEPVTTNTGTQTTDTTITIIPPTVDTTKNNVSVNRYTLVLQPGAEGKDVVINTVDPSLNYPSRSFMHVRAWTINGEAILEKGIIQFDYSMIPAGAIINKATVTFFADTTIDVGSIGHSQLTGSNEWTLKRVTQSWDESTVTWNTEPTTDLKNVIQCPASTSSAQAYVLDLTSWVADEIAHPNSYYGFLMEINNTEPYRAISFCSSDNKYPALRPKMVIEYTK